MSDSWTIGLAPGLMTWEPRLGRDDVYEDAVKRTWKRLPRGVRRMARKMRERYVVAPRGLLPWSTPRWTVIRREDVWMYET